MFGRRLTQAGRLKIRNESAESDESSSNRVSRAGGWAVWLEKYHAKQSLSESQQCVFTWTLGYWSRTRERPDRFFFLFSFFPRSFALSINHLIMAPCFYSGRSIGRRETRGLETPQFPWAFAPWKKRNERMLPEINSPKNVRRDRGKREVDVYLISKDSNLPSDWKFPLPLSSQCCVKLFVRIN